jgi:hypothetical protein
MWLVRMGDVGNFIKRDIMPRNNSRKKKKKKDEPDNGEKDGIPRTFVIAQSAFDFGVALSWRAIIVG